MGVENEGSEFEEHRDPHTRSESEEPSNNEQVGVNGGDNDAHAQAQSETHSINNDLPDPHENEELVDSDVKKSKSNEEIKENGEHEIPLIETDKATKVEVVLPKEKDRESKCEVIEPKVEQVRIEDKQQTKEEEEKGAKKGFWRRLWHSKDAQNNVAAGEKQEQNDKPADTKVEMDSSPTQSNETESKNGGSQTTTVTDVTIPILEKSEKKVESHKELTPTHRLFRVRSPWVKYWMAFATFLGILAFLFGAVLFKYPEALYLTPNSLHENTLFVDTPCGKIRGKIEDNIAVFRGIPFAQPPIGPLRWAPPKAQTCSNLTYVDATIQKPFCFQRPVQGFNISYSEDCLYLDIWSPKLDEEIDENLPVVVYIPGHTLTGQTPIDIAWMPSGTHFVKKYKSLFVTLSYRTGAFGFMALRVLSQQSTRNISGNYGFMDQIAALQWISENIVYFGGDSKQIILFGHGAGANSALILSANNDARNLISRMWLSSPSSLIVNMSMQDVERFNFEFLSSVGCNNNQTIECLQGQSSESVLTATPQRWYQTPYNELPTKGEQPPSPITLIDDFIIKNNPWKEIESKTIPIFVGTTAHESGIVSRDPISNISQWNQTTLIDYIRSHLNTIDEGASNSSIHNYLNSTNDSIEQIYHKIVSDIRVICPLENTISSIIRSENNKSLPIYAYLVEYVPSAPISPTRDNPPSHSPLAIHGLDILAIFDQLTNWYIANPTANDYNYVNTMQTTFHSFIHDMFNLNRVSDGHLNVINRSGVSQTQPWPYSNCAQVWNHFAHFYEKFAKTF